MYRSTFTGLNTTLRGLLSQQAALDVTSHNIANLNTEGYTRQRVDLQATQPWSMPALNMGQPGQLGTGVEVQRYERLRDQFLDMSVRNQMMQLGASDTAVGLLQQIDAAFAEPGGEGISTLMQNFFDALEKVSANPQEIGARAEFAQAADALATGFRSLDARLVDLSNQSDSALNQMVTDVNAITAEINTLNGQIRDSINAGQQPNDLRDRRDQLMDELATKLNYTYTTTPVTEEVTITFGTTTPIVLVDAVLGQTAIVRADLDNAFANGDLTAGEAYAHEDMWSVVPASIIENYRVDLNDLVASLVSSINTEHATGFDLYGNAGGNIFDPASITAANMQLDALNNILTDPRLVAAGNAVAAGDNSNAIDMLQLRSLLQGAPLNDTWESFYSSIVTDVGARAQVAERTNRNNAAVAESLVGRRAEISGVSLDEEMTNMMRFQHAYNASARALTAMDDALDTLINRMGRVGL